MKTLCPSGEHLCLFDDRGTLLGVIAHPVDREPLGPGRDTVFLARDGASTACVAAVREAREAREARAAA
jgi:hypothetical protein